MQETSTCWSKLWTPISVDGLCGWVNTIEEAEAVRKAYEEEKIPDVCLWEKGSPLWKVRCTFLMIDLVRLDFFFTGDVLFWWTCVVHGVILQGMYLGI